MDLYTFFSSIPKTRHSFYTLICQRVPKTDATGGLNMTWTIPPPLNAFLQLREFDDEHIYSSF